MEIFSALLALCEGISPVTCEFPSQWPVTRRCDVLFDLHPNKRLGKQLRHRWFETPSHSLWREYNAIMNTLCFSLRSTLGFVIKAYKVLQMSDFLSVINKPYQLYKENGNHIKLIGKIINKAGSATIKRDTCICRVTPYLDMITWFSNAYILTNINAFTECWHIYLMIN